MYAFVSRPLALTGQIREVAPGSRISKISASRAASGRTPARPTYLPTYVLRAACGRETYLPSSVF
jgi:hypothetical protein